MNPIGYYPGCSLSGGGIELDLSIRAVAKAAGVELKEIDDWNCCGATAAHNLNHDLAVALPFRTLALAEEQGFAQLLAPCAACFSRLKGTAVRVQRDDKLLARIKQITGHDYKRTVRVINISEFFNLLLGAGLADKLPRKLTGLKVAAYYGCLLSRGMEIIENENPERPVAMEAAIRATGAQPVEWNSANECCGGGFSMSNTPAVLDLSHAILRDAEQAGAAAIVVGCPMCHSNLDMRQKNINTAGLGKHDLPILYLSELLGLAAGLPPETLGLDRHFVDATRLMEAVKQ